MVVLPAPSRPRMRIRTSFSPQSLPSTLLKRLPVARQWSVDNNVQDCTGWSGFTNP